MFSLRNAFIWNKFTQMSNPIHKDLKHARNIINEYLCIKTISDILHGTIINSTIRNHRL